MNRFHLIEIEDQSWCPRSLRDAITDCIQFGLNLFNFYGPIYPLIKMALPESRADSILDLGSGAGGPWPSLWHMFEKDRLRPEILLTDKYPNLKAFRRLEKISLGKIGFYPDAVDNLRIPAEFTGFRTFFGAFHHFRPDQARAIIQGAVDSGIGIGIFEVTGRNPLSFILMLGLPLVAVLCGPLIKPLRLSRLLLTYFIPAVPLIGFFDGLISCLRTYSPRELTALVKSLPANNYRWLIGKKRTLFFAPITYLIGIPE